MICTCRSSDWRNCPTEDIPRGERGEEHGSADAFWPFQYTSSCWRRSDRCYVQWLCVQCHSPCMAIHLSFQTCRVSLSCLSILFCPFLAFLYGRMAHDYSNFGGRSSLASWTKMILVRSNAACWLFLFAVRVGVWWSTTQHVAEAFVLISFLPDLNWLLRVSFECLESELANVAPCTVSTVM